MSNNIVSPDFSKLSGNDGNEIRRVQLSRDWVLTTGIVTVRFGGGFIFRDGGEGRKMRRRNIVDTLGLEFRLQWHNLLLPAQESEVSTFSFLDVISLPVTRNYEKVILSNEVRDSSKSGAQGVVTIACLAEVCPSNAHMLFAVHPN